MSGKVTALLGLAMRARKLVLGLDNIETHKGKIYSVYYDGGLSERSQRNTARLAAKAGAVLIKSGTALETVTGKKNCKAAALTDKDMHGGIMKALADGNAGYTIIENKETI